MTSLVSVSFVRPRCVFLVVAVIAGVCGFFAPEGLAAAPLDQVEVAGLFREANQLFQQAGERVATDPQEAQSLYQQAILRLERIAGEGGIENGKLYYNIGNIYFRMRDLGRAILNYRKAEQYIPHDVNLRQNLAFARSLRADQIEEQQQTQILRVLFFWHYDFSAGTRWRLFCLFFALVWIGASVNLFLRKSWLTGTLALCAVLSVFLAGSLITEQLHRQNSIPGVVIAPEVVARKGNSVSYEKSFTDPLHAGTEFRVLETRSDWLHIELADSRTCWVPAIDTEFVR